ncbi:MAG: hypothetical protein SXQ77_11810 [Halobacteria archaeon]|nr:hypothetical protein [Halobacteria archaeon]
MSLIINNLPVIRGMNEQAQYLDTSGKIKRRLYEGVMIYPTGVDNKLRTMSDEDGVGGTSLRGKL